MSVIDSWQQRLASLEVPLAVSSNTLLSTCLTNLIDKGRLSEEEGMMLMIEPSLTGVSSLADMVKRSRFEDRVFYNRNLHINTTNICVLACRFCAFRKGPRHKDAYELSPDQFVD